MSIYDTLNQEQGRAVFQTEGPVLILAGAGSGKTRVLTHRIAYLIEKCNVNPYNIMAITFTNKAAGEMRERVDSLVGFGSESIWVATFHSTCVRILRRYADRIGYDNNFTIYDTDDQKTIIKEACKKLQIDTKMLKERTIMGAISSAKDELISPSQFEINAVGDFNKQKISKVYQEYQSQLRKNNAMDFDDLIVKTVELFRQCPDVLENYQERFKYIMVDEYQDTNTAQFELIRLLANKYRNLCVVGDDDQSIYKFRGANIRNILDFEKNYMDAVVIKLEQNYRSTGNVLAAANAVIRNNVGRKDKALWTSEEDGEKLHFRQFDTAYEEAEHIVYDIAKKKRELDFDYKDSAVLFRTNAQARMLEEQFVKANIPYNVVGGVNFYSRKEIKDILAYLKTIDRVMGYRVGMQCNLGDIEVSDWKAMVRDLVVQTGEQELFDQLLTHMKEHNYAKLSKSELEQEVLELHAARIFDNPLWVDFIPFNKRFRPEVLSFRHRRNYICQALYPP